MKRVAHRVTPLHFVAGLVNIAGAVQREHEWGRDSTPRNWKSSAPCLIPVGGGKWSVGRVVGSPVGAVDVAIGQYTVGDMGSSFGLQDQNIERPKLNIGCG